MNSGPAGDAIARELATLHAGGTPAQQGLGAALDDVAAIMDVAAGGVPGTDVPLDVLLKIAPALVSARQAGRVPLMAAAEIMSAMILSLDLAVTSGAELPQRWRAAVRVRCGEVVAMVGGHELLCTREAGHKLNRQPFCAYSVEART